MDFWKIFKIHLHLVHTFWQKVSKCALSAHILELCSKMCTKCKWIFENFWNFGYILAIFGHILAKIYFSAHILDFFGKKSQKCALSAHTGGPRYFVPGKKKKFVFVITFKRLELEGWNFQGLFFWFRRVFPENFSSTGSASLTRRNIFCTWTKNVKNLGA